MTQYLVAIHRPNDYDPATAEDATMAREIDALNAEMVAAGVRRFVGGLQPRHTARSLRPQADGGVLISEGPYLQTTEHVGGFWVLETASLEDTLAWATRAAIVCRASVEVRPFH